MKYLLSGIFIVFFLIITTHSANAAVYINELSTFTTNDDWIELYADADTDVSGWVIKDDSGVIKTIEDGKVIGSSGYYSINVSNRLNKDGDEVTLYTKGEESLVNQFPYGNKGGPCAPSEPTQSVGRESNGGSSLVRFQISTKDATNDGAPKEPCPTPSPTNVPTSTPTPTLSASNTPTPSPSPTKIQSTPTPSPTKVVSPTQKPTPTTHIIDNEDNLESELVLGESTTITPSPTEVKSNVKGGVKVGARIFLILGLLILGIAIITFTQKMHLLPKR